jgi:spore maturation protein CgeB
VGQDFLMAKSGARMTSLLADVLQDAEMAAELARNGLETIRQRHTCAHRVDELLAICAACSGAEAKPGARSEDRPETRPGTRLAAQ